MSIDDAISDFYSKAVGHISEHGSIGIEHGHDGMVCIGSGYKVSKDAATEIIQEAIDFAGGS